MYACMHVCMYVCTILKSDTHTNIHIHIPYIYTYKHTNIQTYTVEAKVVRKLFQISDAKGSLEFVEIPSLSAKGSQFNKRQVDNIYYYILHTLHYTLYIYCLHTVPYTIHYILHTIQLHTTVLYVPYYMYMLLCYMLYVI
jgi:hypothetical protein